MTVQGTLTGKKIVIVGGTSGIAAEIAWQATEAGASVVVARRGAGGGDASFTTARVDLADEESIRALAEEVGHVDHLISVAADHANGPVTDLERPAIAAAFDAKVLGPILLAKHFAPRMPVDGSMLFFSGVVAWRPKPGLAVMATTNGAVHFLAPALAVDLAPIRVNALSPGIVDSGAWDGLVDDRKTMFDDTAAANPARRVGTPADIASAALLALTNPYVTGTTIHVDGGGRFA